jgi:pimeloyl-ACP methyl ester carboxylesterase
VRPPPEAAVRGVPRGVLASLADHRLPELDPTLPVWPGRYVSAAGASIFVRITPSTAQRPEPALYVHGLAGSSTNWTDHAALLAPWLSGESLDLPGFGRSGPAPGGDYSIRSAARVVTARLEALATDAALPVHLFGNSMGGAICAYVAARRPELVRTLTLVSPAVPDLRVRRPDSDPLLALLLVPGPASAYIERRMAQIPARRKAEGLLNLCFADPSRVPPARLEQAVRELTARQGQPWVDAAFTRSLRGLVRHWVTRGRNSAWQDLARIRAPSLVVWGDRDRLVDVRLAPRVAATVPGCRLLVLSGVGHVAQMEEPRLTARAFLGSLWPGGKEGKAVS